MLAMKRFYRSVRDKQISGLCGGIANYFNVDATFVRLIALVFALMSFGTFIFLYIAATLVVPKEPINHWSHPEFDDPFMN